MEKVIWKPNLYIKKRLFFFFIIIFFIDIKQNDALNKSIKSTKVNSNSWKK